MNLIPCDTPEDIPLLESGYEVYRLPCYHVVGYTDTEGKYYEMVSDIDSNLVQWFTTEDDIITGHLDMDFGQFAIDVQATIDNFRDGSLNG